MSRTAAALPEEAAKQAIANLGVICETDRATAVRNLTRSNRPDVEVNDETIRRFVNVHFYYHSKQGVTPRTEILNSTH